MEDEPVFTRQRRRRGGGEAMPAMMAGRFEVIRVLGEGTFGKVVLVNDVMAEDAPRALKIITLSDHSELRGKQIASVEREAALLRRIEDKEHIVKLFAFGQSADVGSFLCLEVIKGVSLEDLLRREKHLDEIRALKIARQAALGLIAMHKSGVAHCDIKPGNLMIVGADGGEESVKIVDFGVACCVDDPMFDQKSGTPAYMSPELSNNALGTDPSKIKITFRGRKMGDVWALGVVMYEMLSGLWPFKETNFGGDMVSDDDLIKSTLESISSASLPPLPKSISPSTRKLVTALLQRNRKTRETDIHQVVSVIQSILHARTSNEHVDVPQDIPHSKWSKCKVESDLLMARIAADTASPPKPSGCDGAPNSGGGGVKFVTYGDTLRRSSALDMPLTLWRVGHAGTRSPKPSPEYLKESDDLHFWAAQNDGNRVLLTSNDDAKYFLRNIPRISKLPHSPDKRREKPLDLKHMSPITASPFFPDPDFDPKDEDISAVPGSNGENAVDSMSFWSPSNRFSHHLNTSPHYHRLSFKKELRKLYRVHTEK